METLSRSRRLYGKRNSQLTFNTSASQACVLSLLGHLCLCGQKHHQLHLEARRWNHCPQWDQQKQRYEVQNKDCESLCHDSRHNLVLIVSNTKELVVVLRSEVVNTTLQLLQRWLTTLCFLASSQRPHLKQPNLFTSHWCDQGSCTNTSTSQTDGWHHLFGLWSWIRHFTWIQRLTKSHKEDWSKRFEPLGSSVS